MRRMCTGGKTRQKTHATYRTLPTEAFYLDTLYLRRQKETQCAGPVYKRSEEERRKRKGGREEKEMERMETNYEEGEMEEGEVETKTEDREE